MLTIVSATTPNTNAPATPVLQSDAQNSGGAIDFFSCLMDLTGAASSVTSQASATLSGLPSATKQIHGAGNKDDDPETSPSKQNQQPDATVTTAPIFFLVSPPVVQPLPAAIAAPTDSVSQENFGVQTASLDLSASTSQPEPIFNGVAADSSSQSATQTFGAQTTLQDLSASTTQPPVSDFRGMVAASLSKSVSATNATQAAADHTSKPGAATSIASDRETTSEPIPLSASQARKTGDAGASQKGQGSAPLQQTKAQTTTSAGKGALNLPAPLTAAAAMKTVSTANAVDGTYARSAAHAISHNFGQPTAPDKLATTNDAQAGRQAQKSGTDFTVSGLDALHSQSGSNLDFSNGQDAGNGRKDSGAQSADNPPSISFARTMLDGGTAAAQNATSGQNGAQSVVDHTAAPAATIVPAAPAPSAAPLSRPATATQASATREVPDTVLPQADPSAITIRKGTNSEIRVAVRSDVLGPVEIHAELKGNSVSASLTVQKHEAHEALSSSLPSLQHALADQDVRLERIHLVHPDAGQSSQQGSDSGPANHAGQQSRQPSRPANPVMTVTTPESIFSETSEVLPGSARISVHA